MKQELQAARDKDGVFLPHDTYNEQIKENARKEEEIKGLTKELKAKEQELEHFMVSKNYHSTANSYGIVPNLVALFFSHGVITVSPLNINIKARKMLSRIFTSNL